MVEQDLANGGRRMEFGQEDVAERRGAPARFAIASGCVGGSVGTRSRDGLQESICADGERGRGLGDCKRRRQAEWLSRQMFGKVVIRCAKSEADGESDDDLQRSVIV